MSNSVNRPEEVFCNNLQHSENINFIDLVNWLTERTDAILSAIGDQVGEDLRLKDATKRIIDTLLWQAHGNIEMLNRCHDVWNKSSITQTA